MFQGMPKTTWLTPSAWANFLRNSRSASRVWRRYTPLRPASVWVGSLKAQPQRTEPQSSASTLPWLMALRYGGAEGKATMELLAFALIFALSWLGGWLVYKFYGRGKF